MDFEKAVKILNKELEEKNPKSFSSSWIFKHVPSVYHYIRLNHRTENDCIDWDGLYDQSQWNCVYYRLLCSYYEWMWRISEFS